MKKIIGIITNSINKNSDNPFDYRYYTLNNYIKIVEDNNALAICIPFNDDKLLEEKLKICEGILIPGGTNIIDDYQKVVDYAYKNDIPLLGICMGFQVIGLYDNLSCNLIKVNNHYDDINSFYEKEKVSHFINIINDSIFFKIFKKNKMKVNSLHHYQIKNVSNIFKIVAKSDDNVIEVIEAKNKKFIVGVQFHPELLKEYNALFQYFISKC